MVNIPGYGRRITCTFVINQKLERVGRVSQKNVIPRNEDDRQAGANLKLAS